MRSSERRRSWLSAGWLALVMVTVFGAAGAQGVGTPLPELTLRDQHGELVTNDDLRGRRWLLNVWASWCPPCRAELPLLADAAADLADDDVGLLLLNAGETASVATDFLTAEDLNLRTLVDPDERVEGLESTNDVLRRLRARGLPTTFFVDENGTIQATYVGELNADVLAETLADAFGVAWSP